MAAGAFGEFGPPARHLQFVEQGSRRLFRQTFCAMSRWQAAMEPHQRFLGRWTTSGRALRDVGRVRTGGDAHGSTSDDVDRTLAGAVLDGDVTWLEDGIIDPSEGTGPWIADWEPGGSTEEWVWRAVR